MREDVRAAIAKTEQIHGEFGALWRRYITATDAELSRITVSVYGKRVPLVESFDMFFNETEMVAGPLQREIIHHLALWYRSISSDHQQGQRIYWEARLHSYAQAARALRSVLLRRAMDGQFTPRRRPARPPI